ncbi:hypothetical protein B0H19DRAFT_1070986 [Mycena capillaripes]|nr:hypothetical protein B0H19DRAFT_1070984 [Mycena capillaripes]KAJ6555824.1 hypothetical protein B0H19DRAFT_1070986 [Mycena capillaripes]
MSNKIADQWKGPMATQHSVKTQAKYQISAGDWQLHITAWILNLVVFVWCTGSKKVSDLWRRSVTTPNRPQITNPTLTGLGGGPNKEPVAAHHEPWIMTPTLTGLSRGRILREKCYFGGILAQILKLLAFVQWMGSN